MWKLLATLITGPLSSISGDLKEAYKAKLAAENSEDRARADQRIAVLEARRDSILAGQNSPVERWVRPLFALPFVIYINKLIIYDKVMGLGATDPLSPELSNIMMIILGGYFVDAITSRIWSKNK